MNKLILIKKSRPQAKPREGFFTDPKILTEGEAKGRILG
jgi:hypothetical protein